MELFKHLGWRNIFFLPTVLVVAASAREWVLVLTRRRPAAAKESPFVETAYVG